MARINKQVAHANENDKEDQGDGDCPLWSLVLKDPRISIQSFRRIFEHTSNMQLRGSLAGLSEESPVTLTPTEPEDMWHANNLIRNQDILKGHAIRRVTTENSTGHTTSNRVHTELTLRVTSTLFDPAASALHVSGIVTVENDVVPLGKYHTLDLELNRPFTLWKKDGWDSVAVEALRDALNTDRDGAVAAIVMQDNFANICLISDYQTLIKQRVESSGSAKGGSSGRNASKRDGPDAKTTKFFRMTLDTLLRNIDFKGEARPLLLASPGYTAQKFRDFIKEEAARTRDKMLAQIVKNTVVVHSSSGNVYSLNEVLKSQEVLKQMKTMKSALSSRGMDDLEAMIRADDGRACYGYSTVKKAVEEGAAGRGGGVLYINNALFRSQDIEERKKYVAIVDKVKEDGGEVRVLSSDHEAGAKLQALGGVAAMLTYPLVFDDDSDEDAEDQEGDATVPTDAGRKTGAII